ncbi:MAG: DVUA0089 family protein [Phycisphaerales bacterium]
MKKHVVLAAMLAAAAGTGLAYGQCGVLEVVASPGVFEAGTTDIGNHCDDCATLIAFPFPVGLYGGSYNAAYAGSNGTLHFGTYAGSPFGNTCTLPSGTFTGGPSIFPHWDDQRTDLTAPGIFTSVSGAPGSQRFNIEWRSVYYSQNTVQLNYSVTFYEGQSFFDVFYVNIPNSGVSATSAVQANSTVGSSVTTYSCNAANLTSGTAIRYQCPAFANPSCGLLATPATGSVGNTFVATATVTQGIPASAITSVSLDASTVDGGTVALLDDGVFPDAAPGDGIYSGNVTVGALAGFGAQTLTSTVTDAMARNGTCTTTYTVIAPPPANDECAGAFPAVDGSNSYDTSGSTTSAGNGSPCGAIGTDVWFSWTATCGGTTTVSTCGQTVDTAIAVYDNCASATAVACNDDACGLQSTVSFAAIAGTTYYIRMGDFAGGNPHAGTFVLTPAGGGGNPTVSAAAADNTCVLPGDTVTISAAVAAVTCPTSDPIASVSGDASALDAGTVAMLDDGVFPDGAAGDGTYTGSFVVGAGASGGAVTITATAVSSATGSAATAGIAINSADAVGDLPGTAMVMSGDGSPLASISGDLGANCAAGNDVDMYLITICDPANFSATTFGGTSFDSTLFLFDTNGVGLVVNDDVPVGFPGDTTLQSYIGNALVGALPAGNYYLAVSGYDNDPQDEGGQALWLDTPYDTERAPDGPGAASAVSSWTGIGGGGAFTVALTGACSVNTAPPCDPDVNQDGNVDQDDVSYLINVVGGGDNPTGIDPDFNQDGNVDQDDIAALINTVGGGGCP